jgi:Protein of unknown function (DUF3108)
MSSTGALLRPILLSFLVLATAGPAAPVPSPGDSTAENPEPGALTPEASGDGGSSAASAGAESGLAPVPWKVGEYFQFSIDWNGINGGHSLMQVQNFVRVDGRRTYRIITKAESNSFVSKFYKVRDRAESYMDAESLFSRRFVKHLREGGYKKDIDVKFDPTTSKARYADGEVLDVAPRVHDVLSAFYYVRTQPLKDGAVLSIPTHDNKKSYDMVVKVLKRERIEVPAGKFNCVQVEPVLKSEGVFQAKGNVYVWLTDDERRIPVLVKSKVPVGSIAVSLTDMRLSLPGRP